MPQFSIENRNKVSRVPSRASYDRDTIYSIIDEALFCHVGFTEGERPFVIPTLHARVANNIILHGSKDSRLIKHLRVGNEACVAITILDGLVLARSAYHHSANYRSVVLFGRGVAINEKGEKLQALKALTEHILPGRWKDVRKPNQQELDATAVVSIPIEASSAKIRTGPPIDALEDLDLPIWAGLIPLKLETFEPQDDPQLGEGIPMPDYVSNMRK
jgi:nitroimidazol reductase NimA-like FMN-containing flavoprotein (pyridoxamine 5'-phosphate oxidase superfamily)